MLPSLARKCHADQNVEDLFSVTKSTSFIMQLNLKQLKMWFSMWQDWQKRIVICRIIENCSKTNLELLTTSLEPILHLDFSTTLSPLMGAIHHEVTCSFRIQRAADYSLPILAMHSTTQSEPRPNTSQQQIPTVTQSHSNDAKIPPKASANHMIPLESKPSQIFLPAIPTTHLKHKPSPASSDLTHSIISHRSNTIASSPLHRSYNSVLDIRSSVDLLKMTKKYNNATRGNYLHRKKRRTRSCASIEDKQLLLHKKQHQFELYKIQLDSISQWMTDCQLGGTITLLKEIVKMSDKGLLGYLVQCLYHRLQVTRGLDGLSDKLLLRVFSFLDPLSLLKCRMVCLHWYYLASNESLWRQHCTILGEREGIGDIVNAIEAVHKVMIVTAAGADSEGQPLIEIDWLQAYKDLVKLLSRIKQLVKQLADSEEDERRIKLTSAQLRSTLTIREMLESVRASSRQRNLSTQETLLMAPESAVSRRRRLRSGKQPRKQQSDNHVTTNRNDVVSYNEHNDNQPNEVASRLKYQALRKTLLINCGVDTRPTVPSLPNPEGIKCLVLAGLLLPNETPQLNKTATIPTLGRIRLKDISILCLECDERKIIVGCSDRLIRIYDLRSGRLVSALPGHKGSVQCLQFDDHKIVSGSWDTTCIVWDIVHCTVMKVLTGHTDCISCLQFCDSTLVTGSYDCSIKIWEASSWDCLQSIYLAHKKPITCLEFNGAKIYSGSEDKTVKVWNVVDGTKKAILCHTARLTSMILSRLLLITSCSDGDIYLWDLRYNVLLMQWQIAYDNSLGFITGLSIDNKQGKIYAAASDSIVYEWDIATGTCVRSLQGHSTGLTSVWAGHNRIVTASEDHTVSVWNTKKVSGESVNESNHYTMLPVRVVTVHQ